MERPRVESTLTDQHRLNAMTHKFGGKTPVRVHFVDNSTKMFLLDPSVLVRDVVSQVVDKLDIHEDVKEDIQITPYFALYESLDGKSIGRVLPAEEIVVNIIANWTTQSSKLIFMCRLHMSSLNGLEFKDRVAARIGRPLQFLSTDVYISSAEVLDESLLYQQFIQSIYNCIIGQYSFNFTESIELAAYQFIVKFGAYKAEIHKVGFLGDKICEFVPLRHLKVEGLEKTEQQVITHLRDVVQYEYLESREAAIAKYMSIIYRSPHYGRTFFKGHQDFLLDSIDKKVYLAVHNIGIELLTRTADRKLICSYSLGEIMRWSYNNTTGVFTFVLPATCLVASESQVRRNTDGVCNFVVEDMMVSDIIVKHISDAVAPPPPTDGGSDETKGRDSDGPPPPNKRGSMFGGMFGGSKTTNSDTSKDSKAKKGETNRNRSTSTIHEDGSVTTINADGTIITKKTLVPPEIIADLLTDYVMSFKLEQAYQNLRCVDDPELAEDLDGTLDMEEMEHYHHDAPAGITQSKITADIKQQHFSPRAELAALMKDKDAEKGRVEADAELMLDKQNKAAIKIQALTRGFLLRNEWYKEDCAILIQAVFRGHLARMLVSDMIEIIMDGEGRGSVFTDRSSMMSDRSSIATVDSDA